MSVASLNDTSLTSGMLKVMHININGLREKRDILLTEAQEYDIVAVTETKLDSDVDPSKITMPGFHDPVRKDRAEDGGGGIVVYLKTDLIGTRRSDLECDDLESIWLDIRAGNNKFTLGTIYRPPNSPVHRWNLIADSIENANPNLFNKILVVGDLNDDLLPDTPCHLLDIIETFQLFQFISEPTRITPTTETLLDPVISNHFNLVYQAGVIPPFCSDHHGTYAVLNFSVKKVMPYKKLIWSYDEGNYTALKEDLRSTHWDSLFKDDLDETTSNITAHILKLVEKHIPHKEVLVRPRDPPWMTCEVKRLIRKRNRAHRKAKRTKSGRDWEHFRQCRNEVISKVREIKKNFLKKTADKLRDETLTPKQWWAIVKSLTKDELGCNQVPALLDDDGNPVSDPDGKAALLNKFFVDQTKLDDENIQTPHFPQQTTAEIREIKITDDEVLKLLQETNPSKSMGPDNINPKVMKECAQELASPFAKLFNMSLQMNKFPTAWKIAHVTALHKKGAKNLVSNYRPISLLSCVAKLFEKCVFVKVIKFLFDNHLITNMQSGFLPGDSTVNQLISIYDSICEALDDGKEVRAVFCDIKKAFDRVWHRGLVRKLFAYGIKGKLLFWFSDYLTNRKQKVVLRGGCSPAENIAAGVPQGSILGPLLFILYINDIVSNIKSNIRLFADDTSLYLTVEDPNSAARVINADLGTIQEWADKWLVTFSPPKTKEVLFSRVRTDRNHPPLWLNGEEIERVNNHKHLGLTLEKDCSWREHIQSTISKAKKALNILRKLKHELDRKSLETLYFTQVRPILEYADCVWVNCNQYESDNLEKVQLEAIRLITGAPRGTSHNLLYKETGIETLEKRRRDHQLTLYYKIVNRQAPQYLYLHVPHREQVHDLRNNRNLPVNYTRTVTYQKSFFPSSVKLWNQLHPCIRNSPSVDAFKARLKSSKKKPPAYYYLGTRQQQMLLSNMRTESSNLNYHKYIRYLIDDPSCECGAPVETPQHYLRDCPRYTDLRREIFGISVPNIQNLLHGYETMDNDVNKQLCEKVQNFLSQTQRFNS